MSDKQQKISDYRDALASMKVGMEKLEEEEAKTYKRKLISHPNPSDDDRYFGLTQTLNRFEAELKSQGEIGKLLFKIAYKIGYDNGVKGR